MVHALQEAGRVLSPGGALIDVRPLLDRWPLEVSWAGGSHELGRATDLTEPLADDAAAGDAMRSLQSTGGWQQEAQEAFPLFYYWDTPREMQEYLEEQWSDVVTVDESVWTALRSAWATANPDARLRLRMKMTITRYRKLHSDMP